MNDRIIKFRGISTGAEINSNVVVYGFFYIASDGKHYLTNKDHTFISINVIPESVGQFTGLHDKNKVEIFENDILDYLNINNTITQGKVEFVNGRFVARQIGAEKMFSDLHHHCDTASVIGNIFEKDGV